MTPKQRVIINTSATYGRSLLALCFGLFTARWVLAALGQVDFGLYGVVGGLIALISFVNIVLSGSVSRFYAFSIGRHGGQNAIENKDLAAWFNAALSMHIIFLLLLVAIAYPVCMFAVRHWLVIPSDRLETCLWVCRISIFSTAITILSVPYVAMYTAHQLIAELTIFDLVRIFGMFGCSLWLLNMSGDRLLVYAIMMSGVASMIHVIQIYRAHKIFAACTIRPGLMVSTERIWKVGRYAAWKMFGVLGWTTKQHGSSFLINLNFGPSANAAFSIAAQFSSQAASLSSSLMAALTPALTTITGTGDMERANKWTLSSCKFPSLLVILLAVPLVCEIDYVLELWLKTPPPLAKGVCLYMVCTLAISTMSEGMSAALSAKGDIKAWQLVEAGVLILTIPIGWVLYRIGLPFNSIGLAFLIDIVLVTICRLYFVRKLLDIKVWEWMCSVLLPVLLIFLSLLIACSIVHSVFEKSLWRLLLSSAVSGSVILIEGWAIALSRNERCALCQYVRKVLGRWR